LSARVRIRAVLCLVLALANSGPAHADAKLYRWADDAGQVHMTATPPPAGSHPAPPEPPAADAEELPAPPAPDPEPVSPAPPPAARAPDPDVDPCAAHGDVVAAWLAAERKLPPLEAAIERIEADPILGSSTEICPHFSPCTYTSSTREEALRHARAELRAAKDQVGDAEERAHRTGTPDRCLVDPNE
jgi:hypothetical protein